MTIKILGSGCASCKKLYKVSEEAINEMGIQADLLKVEDFQKIASYGVMRTPAIVINEKVKAFGRIPDKDEIKKFIHDENK